MSISGVGNVTAEEDPKTRRDLLLKVYDAAINEYRFNVQLSWDRTKFFLVLSAGLIGAGVGLLKVAEGSVLDSAFLAFFFLFAALITSSGLATLSLGKRYYREAVFTKTLVERELGLLDPLPGLNNPRANLSIAVTEGQRDYATILAGRGPIAASQISPTSVAGSIRTIFSVVIVTETLGVILAAFDAINAATHIVPPIH